VTAVHGRKAKFYVNGYDLTGYMRSATISRTADMAEASPFLTDVKRYVSGMFDSTISAEGMYDGSALAVDATLQGILGSVTTAIILVDIGTEAVGSVAHGLAAAESTYDVDTATDDVAAITAEFQSSAGGGAERCLIHKPLTAITTANDGDGTAIDNGALTAFGGVGYLQVLAASGGGTLTVKVQHSVDNAVWADLITFAGATAIGAERKTVTGTVNRYTRASEAITAGSQTYVMAFGRKTY
jgi:hypothetical protein